jgi:hypothetical protein
MKYTHIIEAHYEECTGWFWNLGAGKKYEKYLALIDNIEAKLKKYPPISTERALWKEKEKIRKLIEQLPKKYIFKFQERNKKLEEAKKKSIEEFKKKQLEIEKEEKQQKEREEKALQDRKRGGNERKKHADEAIQRIKNTPLQVKKGNDYKEKYSENRDEQEPYWKNL